MNDIKEKLCVVMPVYNEQAIIGTVLEKWDDALLRLGMDYEIRPYNDGSKDDSLAVMRKVAEGRAHINVKDKPNGGHGNTILTAYREAVEDGFDWVFQIDSDDEMEPEKFSELWSKRGDYDFLVGMRDGRKQALPRKIISFVSRLCVRIFYGKSVWDVNAPYRLMRVTKFAESFKRIPLDTFAPNVILSGIAAQKGLRCFELPVSQHDRTTGEVSIKKWKLLKASAKSFWQTIAFAVGRRELISCFIIFAMALLVVIMHIPGLTMNISTDLNVWALGGKILLEGGKLYVDYFDHKGPVIFLINALGQYLIGDEYFGVWFLEWAFFSISCAFLWRGLYRRLGLWAATFAVLALLIFKFDDSFYARPESFMVEYAAMSIGLLLLHVDFVSCGVTGAGIALAFFMKQPLISPFLAIFITIMLMLRGRKRLHAFIWFSIAAFCTAAVIILWMYIVGILAEYWRDCFTFNLLYQNNNTIFQSGFSTNAMISGLYQTLKNLELFIGIACAGIVAIFVFRPITVRKVEISLLCAWCIWMLMDLFMVSRCGRNFEYYYYPIKFACLLSVLPLVYLCEYYFLYYNKPDPRCLLLSICVIIPLLLPFLFDETSRFLFYLQQRSRKIETLDYISRQLAHMDKNLPLFVWGNNTEVYLNSGRRSISPYYYYSPLNIDNFLSDEEVERFMLKMQTKKVIVIDKIDDTTNSAGIFDDGYIFGDSRFKMRLRAVLLEKYKEIAGINGSHIYMQK